MKPQNPSGFGQDNCNTNTTSTVPSQPLTHTGYGMSARKVKPQNPTPSGFEQVYPNTTSMRPSEPFTVSHQNPSTGRPRFEAETGGVSEQSPWNLEAITNTIEKILKDDQNQGTQNVYTSAIQMPSRARRIRPRVRTRGSPTSSQVPPNHSQPTMDDPAEQVKSIPSEMEKIWDRGFSDFIFTPKANTCMTSQTSQQVPNTSTSRQTPKPSILDDNDEVQLSLELKRQFNQFLKTQDCTLDQLISCKCVQCEWISELQANFKEYCDKQALIASQSYNPGKPWAKLIGTN